MISLIWVILKEMIQMNLFTKQEQIHRLRAGTYDYQQGKDGGTRKLGNLGSTHTHCSI